MSDEHFQIMLGGSDNDVWSDGWSLPLVGDWVEGKAVLRRYRQKRRVR